MVPVFAQLKELQSGDAPRWLRNPDDLLGWLDDIKLTMQEPSYQFKAVYVTLIDPQGIAKPPVGVVDVFDRSGYHIWDVTNYAQE
jgi:hypothetical protein